MYSPEIVVGYLIVFDVSKDFLSQSRGRTWCGHLRNRLGELSGRSAPSWSVGMIEAFTVVEVDFSQGARLMTPESDVQILFDILAVEVKKRNPLLGDRP